MALINCPECQKEISEKSLQCIHCGCPIASGKETVFCSKCGKQIDAEAVVCPFCGIPTPKLQQQTQAPAPVNVTVTNTNVNTNRNDTERYGKQKNKWLALVLCFFLGYIGAHKFYEGKIGMGILYLCTGGLFGIGVVFSFIALLFKPNPYFV